ncbi:hypothetical protein QOT17_014026 [Balamuthia mandrillaris]
MVCPCRPRAAPKAEHEDSVQLRGVAPVVPSHLKLAFSEEDDPTYIRAFALEETEAIHYTFTDNIACVIRDTISGSYSCKTQVTSSASCASVVHQTTNTKTTAMARQALYAPLMVAGLLAILLVHSANAQLDDIGDIVPCSVNRVRCSEYMFRCDNYENQAEVCGCLNEWFSCIDEDCGLPDRFTDLCEDYGCMGGPENIVCERADASRLNSFFF